MSIAAPLLRGSAVGLERYIERSSDFVYFCAYTRCGSPAEAGWEKVMTADRRPYYQNKTTKQTSWSQPHGWTDGSGGAEAETTVGAHGSFFKSGGTVDTSAAAAAAAAAASGAETSTRGVPGENQVPLDENSHPLRGLLRSLSELWRHVYKR